MEQWDLFSKQPLKLFHPAEVTIPVAAVSKIKNGVVWWNANSLVEIHAPDGLGYSSGFAENPLEDAKVTWDGQNESWLVVPNRDPNRIYRFALPDEKLLKQWEEVKQWLPSIEELQKEAKNRYGSQGKAQA